MVTFVKGHRSTGKSLHYEKELERKDNRVYFATLWEDKDTILKIKQHKDRRDDNWIVIESVGDTQKDIYMIKKTLSTLKQPVYFMIDGLVNWCVNCAFRSNDIICEAQKVSEALVSLLLCYKDVNWYLLDNVSDDYKRTPILIEVCKLIYNNIIKNVPNIKVVEWRQCNENFMG